MTLRERLHHQIDSLDAQQLAALDVLLTQLTRPQRAKHATAAPPQPSSYLRAQRLMADQASRRKPPRGTGLAGEDAVDIGYPSRL